jgi:hypothetical protein
MMANDSNETDFNQTDFNQTDFNQTDFNQTGSNEIEEEAPQLTLKDFGLPLKIFLSLSIIVSILGNLLVIVAVIVDRRLRRRRPNLFIVSLAISDLLVSTAVMPFALVNDTEEWRFGPV